MNSFSVLAICLSMLISCKKDSDPPPVPEGDPNNELRAVVSLFGGIDSIHHTLGNRTTIARTARSVGDSVIIIQSSIGEYGTYSARTIEITLGNVTSPGTYPFRYNANSFAQCMYQIGNVFFSQVLQLYFADRSDEPGSITIDVLTPTSIQGTFNANCSLF